MQGVETTRGSAAWIECDLGLEGKPELKMASEMDREERFITGSVSVGGL